MKKYMKLCYKEMLKSYSLTNSSPLVGALILFENKKHYTSHRDVVSPFKHAESILLHKYKDIINENTILFITLEPCVSFKENKQTISCCELIVKSKIKKVFIGMIDPNPKIKNKGVEFLKKHNIEVNYFSNNIIKKIKRKNKCFINSFD